MAGLGGGWQNNEGSSPDGNNNLIATTITLTAAQVKAIKTSPVLAVAAPGSGFAIEVISGSASLAYGSVAFLNTQLLLKTDTATLQQAVSGTTFLTATNNVFQRLSVGTGSFNSTQLVENKGLYITAAADSANGDSAVKVYILYRIIAL